MDIVYKIPEKRKLKKGKGIIRPAARVIVVLMGCVAAMLAASAAKAQSSAEFKSWGEETLEHIQKDFWIPDRGLYADEWKRDAAGKRKPAFMWGCGVMLPALVAGAAEDSKHYLASAIAYTRALDIYTAPGTNRVPGYDVLPGPKPPDRYYDDNMWMDIALVDEYDLSRDRVCLQRATLVYKFILTGEDDKLGGGIYWRESDRASKNTCSNGPAVVAALRLYQTTGMASYLADARRIYAWTNAHLQDSDGLYWDNIKLSGAVEKTKWSYNTALMLRANVMLYSILRDKKYLDEAERLAKAAESRWIRPETGAIAEGGQFAHLLSEAFLALNAEDHDEHWITIVRKALAFVHDKLRDSEGRYGDHWDEPVTSRIDKAGLLSQACVARAYFMAAHALALAHQ